MALAEPPPLAHLSRAASEALARRRRGRNIAMMVGLLALVALFYFIALAKMSQHARPPVTPAVTPAATPAVTPAARAPS